MGALFRGQCFADAAEAAHLYFSEHPYVVVPGSTTYHARFRLESGVWYRKVYEDSTLIASNAVAPPDFPFCDSGQSAADGVALGFLVIACWFAAWGVAYLGTVIRGRA